MKTPTTGLLAVLGASALLAAGCGSSSKTASSTTAAATPASNQQSSSTASTTASASGVSVTAKHDHKLGAILAAGPKKMTVYLFEADKGKASSCSGECASAWPPVTTDGSPAASGAAKSSQLGTIQRSDGTTQVTFAGHPLYYFVRDKDSGDAYGQGSKAFGAGWYVLSSSGKKVDDDGGDSGKGGAS
jgi:predicted lipoprotein with Yx(FWY)xxD motif